MNRRMAKAESARKFHAAQCRVDAEFIRLADGRRTRYQVAMLQRQARANAKALAMLGNAATRAATAITGMGKAMIDLEARAAAEHAGFGLDTAWLDEMQDKRPGIDKRWLTAHFPFDPWPCGGCSVVTQDVAIDIRTWRTVPTHVVTCAECRALGAPETVPYK